MQLLHQTISKLKGFKEWFDTLDLHESQLVLGLSGSVKHLAESCAFEKFRQAISDCDANALTSNANLRRVIGVV